MTKIFSVAICAIFALLLPGAAQADIVRLRAGDVLEGRVSTDSYTIRTTARGDLVIPATSIQMIHFRGDGEVTIRLVDGGHLDGRLLVDRILLDQGLYASSFLVRDVAEITLAERRDPVVLPKGTPVKLMLAEWLHSRSARPGQTVKLCVAEDVHVGSGIAVPKGTPATGRISTGRAAAAMSQQGEVAIEPQYVLVPGGSRVSVGGPAAEFKGGLDPGAFVIAGVLGFFARGQEVKVPPGPIFEVVTKTEMELGIPADASDEASEAWLECRRFFRFADVDEVQLEEVDLHEAYAPFGTSLAVSLPLDDLQDLEDGDPLDRSLRNLLAYDTYLQTVAISTNRGRKRVKVPVRLFLAVLPSHDKRVDLELSLVEGEEVLAQETERDIDAEEEKAKQVQMTLVADSARFDQALASGSLRLRIAMIVTE